MLMSFDELDSLMKHYLNPTAYSHMCEILDTIRAKVNSTENNSSEVFYFIFRCQLGWSR